MRSGRNFCGALIVLLLGACASVPPSLTPSLNLVEEPPSPAPPPPLASAGSPASDVGWESVECGRLAAPACEEAARLSAGIYEVATSIGPGYRFVVDLVCPPDEACPEGSPAIAVIARPGWQGLAGLAPFEVIGEASRRRAETLDERQVPGHVIELVKQAPADPTALWRPDLMLATPSRVEPGGRFDVTFPEGRDRSLGYALEYWAGDEWHFRYDLGSRVGREPGWQEAGIQGGWEIDLAGISGPGPDRLLIPPVAEPGAYRVCTAIGTDNICALLEVSDPDASVDPAPDLTQSCTDPDLAFEIRYPTGWWVHPADAAREVAACSQFGPSPFELAPGDSGILEGGTVTVLVTDGCTGYDESPITHYLVGVDGLTGYVDEYAPGFTPGGTWYVIDLFRGGSCMGSAAGRHLFAGTTRAAPGDYVENRRILDAMVQSLDFRTD